MVFSDGLTYSMRNYAKDVETRMELNKLQIDFQCCGSIRYCFHSHCISPDSILYTYKLHSYTDWFKTNWTASTKNISNAVSQKIVNRHEELARAN